MSDDGLVWTYVGYGGDPDLPLFWSVASNGSLLAAVGGYTSLLSPRRGMVYTSSDGLAWAPQGDYLGFYLTDVAWAGDRFVAVGWPSSLYADGDNAIFYSADGLTWSADSGGPKSPIALNGVTFNGDHIVVVGRNGAIYLNNWFEMFADGFESGDTSAWDVAIQ